MLGRLGLQTRLAPNALIQGEGGRPVPPRRRADDLNSFFDDDDVAAIVCLGGGGHSHAVLPYLDWPTVWRTPKIVMGYSAITSLLVGMAHHGGLITFHGPMILDGFGEYPELFDYTRQHLQRVLFDGSAPLNLTPPEAWTCAFPMDDRPRKMQPQGSQAWHWVRSGSATGQLLGGNLAALRSLTGTQYWPNFEGAVIFIEEVNMGQGVLLAIEESLAHLRLLGVFDQIAGLVMAKTNEVSDQEARTIDEIVAEYVRRASIPVLTGVDFGHTDPRLVLPIGARATLDSATDTFRLEEPGVA